MKTCPDKPVVGATLVVARLGPAHILIPDGEGSNPHKTL